MLIIYTNENGSCFEVELMKKNIKFLDGLRTF